jgi:putative membrane protein
MKVFLLALTTISVLAVPAFGQSVGEKTGINAMIGTAPKTEDFAKMVAVSDMFEIESSKLAQAGAEDAKVKTFAAKMVKDHTETSNELKGLVSSGKVKVDLPAALDSSHQSKLDKLKGLKGGDFDKQYKSDQEAAHKDAVSLFERYGKGGDNGDLKAFASKTLPHLQEHLKMAEDMNR